MDEEEDALVLASLPLSFAEITDANCPLIMTYEKLLSMVDASFPVPFLRQAKDAQSIENCNDLYNIP